MATAAACRDGIAARRKMRDFGHSPLLTMSAISFSTFLSKIIIILQSKWNKYSID